MHNQQTRRRALTRFRAATLLTLSLVLSGLVVTTTPNQASAVQSFNNAAIADAGLAEVGTSRPTGWNQPGECIKSVQRWVAAAGGYFGGGGVISGYVNSGAEEVSLASAVKGDVIQYTNGNGNNNDWSYVHTVVVVNNHGNGRFDIVQSNSPAGSGLVTRVNDWAPSPAPGWVSRVWRFGLVQATEPEPSEPPHHDRDFNGNGKADILWYGPGSAQDAIWYGNADRDLGFNKSIAINVDGTYTPITGDFDGDGRGDILWYGPGDAHDAMWYGTGTGGEFTWYPVDVRGIYTPVVGDFNGNGKDDILWYGPGSDTDAIWYGNTDRSMGFNKSVNIDVSGTYEPISGDFDGDGKYDILWYGPGDAHDAMWYGMYAGGEFSWKSVDVRGIYTPVAGDFNGNGRWDILWYGPGSDTDAIWYGNADRDLGFNKTASVNVAGVFTPVPGDFDGDRKADILWYGPGDAHDTMWYGMYGGGEFSSRPVTVRGTYVPIVAG